MKTRITAKIIHNHFKERVSQRCGVELKPVEISRILWNIQKDKLEKVSTVSLTRSKYLFPLNLLSRFKDSDIVIIIIYDKKHKRLVTALRKDK
jgi:hypothetical protein